MFDVRPYRAVSRAGRVVAASYRGGGVGVRSRAQAGLRLCAAAHGALGGSLSPEWSMSLMRRQGTGRESDARRANGPPDGSGDKRL